MAKREPSGREQPQDHGTVVQVTQHAEFFSGPIPHPALLREYDAIDPGRARKILDLFEEQSRHRMALEKTVVASDVVRSWAGLVCGFVISLAALAVAGWLVYLGHATSGAVLAGFDLASLVGTFVYGTYSRRREREHKTALIDRK
ncbi:MAG: DUF2335 domain-containing protein [Planctomycetia bacterium]|nr:DUF2335 domain-containing protein [Planctomycetia bacterium]